MKTDAHWDRVGRKDHHGIVVPLFSLHSKQSCGVGEFLDLIPLIDWCADVGFNVIQLLPLNDSGWDMSPYYAISSCALDPVYISLHALPDGQELPQSSGGRLEVKRQKLEWLRTYFEAHPVNLEPFKANHPWVCEYAQSDFDLFVQQLAFEQMSRVRAHATARGVLLKGDIPILVSPESIDVQAHPDLFDCSVTAGAPPDLYNPLGQNWGFPLFRWDAMRHEHYRWWKERLRVISQLYHLYRIDHVVGFFRIWAIEKGVKPSQGHFIPEDPTRWLAQGRELLEMMIRASPLLPMAEDLGTIPKGVEHVLRELGIAGTKVLLWQFRKTEPRTVIPYHLYNPLSLTTVSTADSEPLGLAWRKYPDLAEPFARLKKWTYDGVLKREQREELLRDAHHTSSYFHINLLQEYLALFEELSWGNPEADRINVPGTVLATNWTYKFRPSVEEIATHEGLRAAIQRMIGCRPT